jgi:hypothetical protein
MDIFKAVESRWTGTGARAAEEVPSALPCSDAVSTLDADPASADQEQAELDDMSCAYVGRYIIGRVAPVDTRVAVSRMLEIMGNNPIRPYLNAGGGSGFAYDLQWASRYDDIVTEFECLWWTAAGDAIIARYGHLMPLVCDGRRGNSWRLRPWKHEAGHGLPQGPNGGTRQAVGAGAALQGPCFP